MTVIDFVMSWPIWLKWVAGITFTIWLIESLLLPFKLNLCITTLKRIEGLVTQLYGDGKDKEDSTLEYKKMLQLLQIILSDRRKDEDK